MHDVAMVQERPTISEKQDGTGASLGLHRLLFNRSWKIWCTAFVAFFLMGGAWALAAPYDGTPDETAHVIRAAGVAKGQILRKPEDAAGGTGAVQRVGAGLVPHNNTCYHSDVTKTPACADSPGTGGDREIDAGTGAGRYNPLYYAAVGGPLALWPNWVGLLLARLISAAICAAFLASAVLSCVRWRRSPLLLAGLVVAVTPVVIHLSGGINPNSVEIAASISLFAALIPLLLSREDAAMSAWLRRAAIAAIVVAQLRTMGPEIIVGALLVMLVPPVRARIRQLWAHTATRWWGLGVVISMAAGVVWTQVADAAEIGHYASDVHYTLHQALAWELDSRLPWYLTSMADGLSYFDTNTPYVGLGWTLAFGALLLFAVACGTNPQRWRLVALSAGVIALPVVVDVTTVNSYGFPFQARYMLPLAVGLPLLAAFVIGQQKRLDAALNTSITRIFVVALLPLQWVALVQVMIRWQHGLGLGRPINPFTGSWLPPLGPVLPIASMTVALAVLGVLIWQLAGRRPSEDQSPLVSLDNGRGAHA